MIVGFNHNISYRGVTFHVQTEDSGPKNPNLVTLLYHAGTIITSQKTVYADILNVGNLDQVVEDLAKEQHKGMLKRLTKGEFDERIVALGIKIDLSGLAKPTPTLDQVSVETAPAPKEASLTTSEEPPAVTIVEEAIIDKFRKPKEKQEGSLDEIIYAYLTAGHKS